MFKRLKELNGQSQNKKGTVLKQLRQICDVAHGDIDWAAWGKTWTPDVLAKLLDVVEAAQIIRYEWNVGQADPQEESLCRLFKCLKALGIEHIDPAEKFIEEFLEEHGEELAKWED